MEQGYEKGSSDNLPCVDTVMVDEFYENNLDFLSAERRNIKNLRATRESYGDNAIGHVQLQRVGAKCTVKAKITPEHKTSLAKYNVVAVIDEVEEKVLSSKCLSFPAAAGGCKHGIAFLFWLHRRSEEPSVTSVECYWLPSKLSKVGKSLKSMSLAELCSKEIPPLKPKGNTFRATVLENVKGATGGIFDFTKTPKHHNTSIYHLILQYCETNGDKTNATACIDFFKEKITASLCQDVEKSTRSQSNCPDWYELRFGRITASKIYEASRCKTKERSLTETILGGAKFEPSQAIITGRELEPQVIQEVSKIKKIEISPCGLLIKKNFPIFGASPDGICDEFVIEVKCPSKQKIVSNYVEGGVIKNRYKAQIQIQMYFAERDKGLFCVAQPNFEQTKGVNIYEVALDTEYCEELMEHSLVFWKTAIFPLLIN